MISSAGTEAVTSPVAARVRDALRVARHAQHTWEKLPVAKRARLVNGLRHQIAEHATSLATASAAASARPIAEKLVSEVLPLADACRFLGRNGAQILRRQRFGRSGRPVWLTGSFFEIERKAFGVVLIVAPRNYPLFLPVVQMLHALVAGNAVLVKPAANGSGPVVEFVKRVLAGSGIPAELIQVLPEAVDAAHEAVRAGADKVIFTGNSENGRDLLATMATRNTPGVMELSGADAVFVLHDADLDRAAKAIAFGLRLNAGDTCMAPHAIFADAAIAAELLEHLQCAGCGHLEITTVPNAREALDLAASSEHGLGASIFSRDENAARAFARELHTGFVTINDIIVPTADPRFPFGGTRSSGYGITRGAAGLLEMTFPHVIALRRGNRSPHLEDTAPGDEAIFASYIALAHRRDARGKFRAARRLLAAARGRLSRRKS